jgi:hypothetical protein
MPSKKSLFFVMFLALCLLGSGQQIALGADNDCAEFKVQFGSTDCKVDNWFNHLAYGGGWDSTLRAGNPSTATKSIWLNFDLLSKTPYVYDGHYTNAQVAWKTNRSDKWNYGNGTSGIELKPGQSIELYFLYPMKWCDKYGAGCIDEPDYNGSLNVASLNAFYTSPDPAALRVPKPSVTFNNRVLKLQGTVFPLDSASSWRVPFNATADRGIDLGLAIGNPPNSSDITMKASAFNQSGVVLRTVLWNLKSESGMAFFMSEDSPSAPGFGASLFPGGKNFTGTVEIEVMSPANAGITVTALQFTDGAMSTGDAQALKK